MAILHSNDTSTFYVKDQSFRPYPFTYKKDRRISLITYSYPDKTDYRLVFVNACLDWQHTRVYELNEQEYERIMIKLFACYGEYASMSVFAPHIDYDGSFSPCSHHIDFKFDWS